MKELIERLEQADAGSRELDAEIAKAVGASFTCWCTGACDPEHEAYQGACVAIPHFSSSIDSALTLVPEGFTVSVFICDDLESACHLESSCELWPGNGSTPALAICIATLRARGENP